MPTTETSAEEALREAWALLLDRSDQIADTITLTLFERDHELWERIGPEFRADVRSSTRQHIRRGLQILSGLAEEESGPEANAVELWRETGRRRARQGVPLELLLNAYNLGARTLWEALVGRVSGDPSIGVDDQVLLLAGRSVWTTLDVQNTVIIDAYNRESSRMQRQDLQREQGVLDNLIDGRGADPGYAEEARSTLGIGADDSVACVAVIQERGDLADVLGPAEDRLDRLEIVARWHVRSGVHYGLLSGNLPDEGGLVELFASHVPGRTGVAMSTDGVAGFAAAFQLACRAAESVPRGVRQVVALSDRLPEVLLAGSPQVAPRLLAETLAPVMAQPKAQAEVLLDTLEALLRHDGSPTHAATELYCHRNTVIYRMKQVEQLTGRSLADPRDKMLLGLALMARPRG
ncbi:helix-turn-helix domain-containing protein [Nocardioides sp. Y6]|uniref:Helix-turn-helix domain-containing protein n=1 Tax=Nocardioides malaquae TaxID=2773426 RepID=A0ABR9RRT5_9ACTN|nr:PucR family transcriptional regulator [Nocardioides malaquae]MBE7323865.1 helix-turn-helix domain-containing protein [Nocardioides malaquae]